jgi:CBS domain-containing protein
MAKNVRDLLRVKGNAIYWVTPEATVYVAVEQMAERGVGALLVMDGESLEGIVSERDYARQVILRGRSSKQTCVREIMTADVVCVSPERSIEECMALMTERRIRHLPVVDSGEVIGVISIGDVVRAVIDERDFHIAQLESYIATA